MMASSKSITMNHSHFQLLRVMTTVLLMIGIPFSSSIVVVHFMCIISSSLRYLRGRPSQTHHTTIGAKKLFTQPNKDAAGLLRNNCAA